MQLCDLADASMQLCEWTHDNSILATQFCVLWLLHKVQKKSWVLHLVQIIVHISFVLS